MVYVLFLLYMFLMKGTSELFLQCLTVSFNIILFLQSLQMYFIYPNLQHFSFYSLPLYFLSGIFTLTWLYSLIFLLLLGSGYFTPYRCLFLTLYFSSTFDHFFFGHSIFNVRWNTFIYLSRLSLSFLCLPYIDFSHLLLK